MHPCKPCGGNVNYTVPQPASVQPGGGDTDPPTTPELSDCPVHFIETSEDFDFPAPGETSIIRSCCSDGIAPGAILYSLGIGYLHVESIPNECEIEVSNHGETCNVKTPGEPVASGTKLQIGIPLCGVGEDAQSGKVCLTTDFFVPDYCDSPEDTGACCVDVGVTSVANLVVGQRLALGVREFRLAEIINAGMIRICNDGAGGLPGAVVYAMDDCFEIIGGINICERNDVDGGKIIVCRDGGEFPVAGSYDGQILQWDSALGRFKLVAAPPLPICTSLDADFTVDSTNPAETNYIIDVFDSSNFVGNQSVQINEQGGTLRRFTVVTIIDGTHIRVHPAFTVSVNTTFKAGASVCEVEDKCGTTAIAASAPASIDAMIACIGGTSTPLYPSANNKVLVGLGNKWKEYSRGLNFFPVFATFHAVANNVDPWTYNFNDIGGGPPSIGSQTAYLEMNVGARLSSPTGTSQYAVYINGTSWRTLGINSGGSDEERFTLKIPASAGGSFVVQMVHLSGVPNFHELNIIANGYFA